MATQGQPRPVIRGKMGEEGSEITYYVLKMSIAELVRDVLLTTEISTYDNKTLSDTLQRTLKKSRSKKDIARYLAEAHKYGERFMGSFVLAAWGGNPQFMELKLDESDSIMKYFKDSGIVNDFGLLSLDSSAEYFVLDGQHRLAGIRSLLNFYEDDPSEYIAPPGLKDDDVSVILITSEGLKEHGTKDITPYKQRLRRIFTVLNRHAKKTTITENIIMDEDDIAAIITRKLVNELPIFQWSGEQQDTPVVLTTRDSLSEKDQHLTTLSTIYFMNKHLIKNIFAVGEDYFNFSTGDDDLEEKYKNLKMIWEVMIDKIPDWTKADRGKMKNHVEIEDRGDDGSMDHLLFWPVGQKGLALYLGLSLSIAMETKSLNKRMVEDAMGGLDKIDWDLFSGPWRGLILRQTVNKNPLLSNQQKGEAPADVVVSWKIFASAQAENVVADMLLFLTGKLITDEKQIENFRNTWENKLQLYKSTPEQREELWNYTLKIRKAASK
tara:strand:+ start:60 stop:1541 length:1482 start_codon:yes stop_codon:yes gene_type:complete